jgi:UDP-N-acetylglucosamine transferase subunit ALG13
MVVVSAGTYHLPFNRLVDWMEPWVLANAGVHVIMQHGPGRPLPGAENHSILPYAELLDLCAVADAIVLQGGAGGVMDMRQLQRVPIVVPRIPVNGEVVDNHQLLFTERAAELHTIRRATTANELWQFLDRSLTGALDNHAERAEPTPGVSNVAELLAALPAPLSRGIRRRRLGHSLAGVLNRR